MDVSQILGTIIAGLCFIVFFASNRPQNEDEKNYFDKNEGLL
jgi:hypothetical protein